MSEQRDRIVKALESIESHVTGLAAAFAQFDEDARELLRGGYQSEGRHGSDALQAAGLQREAMHGVINGRLRALGLDGVLQRGSHTTPDTWVVEMTSRIDRVLEG